MALQPARLRTASFALLVGLLATAHPADAQDLSRTLRRLDDIEVDAQRLGKSPLRRSQLRSATHVEERLTDGELFFRLQDYVRASVIFTDIVDNYPKHRAHAEALFLLAESLYEAGDYLGARNRYREIIAAADVPAYRRYVARALGRLIEIAIHTRDYEGVEGYFERLAKLPASQIDAATNYYRAKYLYSLAVGEGEDSEGTVERAKIDQAQLERARAAFASVEEGNPFHPRARYFVGVIQTLRGQLASAIDSFERVIRMKPEGGVDPRVRDLARLAVGRLHYEQDDIDAAVQAYQSVDRTSPLFDTALFEVAWAFIRIGDSTRAERALEVMSVAAPDSRHIPDGKLLRGNLLLRNGRYDDARAVFENTADQFQPVRDELDRMIARHDDPQAYFRELVRQNLEVFDVGAFLPPLALQWTGTSGDMERAMDALSDLSTARRLVKETSSIVERLTSALSASNPVNVFRDLRQQRELSTTLRNRLLSVRRDLAAIDARATAKYSSPELEQVRKQRRELENRLGGLPTDQDDIADRNLRVVRQYVLLEKELSKLEVELLGMEARITASQRYIDDTITSRDPAAIEAVRSELRNHQNAVGDYRDAIERLRVDTEAGRLQVGVGDDDFAREAELRAEYEALLARERQLLTALGASPDPRIDSGLQRVAAVSAALDRHDAAIDAVVSERVADMRKVLAEERVNLEGYRTRLVQLEGESEIVVGGIAYANFREVQQRFYDLVLRADVGVIDVAWAVREEHRMRAEMLTRDRTRALQALDDEFRDIMDEGGAQ
ncbi:MAG: tetratricopeptide repeat protein [Myxococcales bacterium]|jgi:TolA-binding protein